MSIDYKKIKIGDVHYEQSYGINIAVKVISEPIKKNVTKSFGKLDDKERYQYKWSSKIIKSNGMTIGALVSYTVTEGMEHYGPDLYDYKAYVGME